MKTDNRKNNFNIIRFFAAMMVVLGHMCHLTGEDITIFMGQDIGTVGVKIFFLISGYLIAQSFLNDSNILRYAIRRSFRIVPGLIGVVLFSVLIVGPVFTVLPEREYFTHPMTLSYLKNTVLYIQYALPGVFETNPYPNAINGSLWTLPIEVFMYIVLPVVFICFRKCNKLKVAACLAVISQITNLIIIAFRPGARFVVYATNIFSALNIIPYFFVGIIFISPKTRKYLNLQLAIGLMCIAEMLSLSEIGTEIVLFIVLPYFVFSFSFVENPMFVKCFSKNDFSYGLYLYGFVIQQSMVKILGEYELSLNVHFVISALVTLVFAILSWFLIEKPAQKFAKRLLNNNKIAGLSKINLSSGL